MIKFIGSRYCYNLNTIVHTKLIILAIVLQVTGEPLIRRSDDNAEALKTRLASYHNSTKPLVDYYSQRNIHTLINAAMHPSIVFGDIVKAFTNAQARRSGATTSKEAVVKKTWRPFASSTS